MEDQLVLAGNPISLSGLQVPVLNAYARKDHLVPAPSSAALAQHVDETLYDNAEFDGGHVGLMVSKKAQGTILTDIGSWLTGP